MLALNTSTLCSCTHTTISHITHQNELSVWRIDRRDQLGSRRWSVVVMALNRSLASSKCILHQGPWKHHKGYTLCCALVGILASIRRYDAQDPSCPCTITRDNPWQILPLIDQRACESTKSHVCRPQTRPLGVKQNLSDVKGAWLVAFQPYASDITGRSVCNGLRRISKSTLNMKQMQRSCMFRGVDVP